MIILKLSDKTIELNTYEVDGKQLYKAQDLLYGYGMDRKKVSNTISNWKISMETDSSLSQVVVVKNGYSEKRGTYLDKTYILMLAGYISKDVTIIKEDDNAQVIVVKPHRKELCFGEILIEALKELNLEVIPQYRVGNYRIDFYIPKYNIAVEYDEQHHFTEENKEKDNMRQMAISLLLNSNWIRCDYKDSDINNLMKVLAFIDEIKLNNTNISIGCLSHISYKECLPNVADDLDKVIKKHVKYLTDMGVDKCVAEKTIIEVAIEYSDIISEQLI